MEKELRHILQTAISERIFPGCALGIVRANGERTVVCAGNHTYEADSPPVTSESVYDLASITKSIPTASLALQLLDERRIALDDRVIDYIPELTTRYRDLLTIRHLLTYTAIFDVGGPLAAHKDKTPPELLGVLFKAELAAPPGGQFAYTNAPSIILGVLVERVTGKPLDVSADERLFKPLDMDDTTFHPSRLPIERIVPTEIDPWRGGLVHAAVHDETAYVLQQEFLPGNAGLFSTVSDLATFVEMLLRGGEYGGRRYFSAETMAAVQTNQISQLDARVGLGWELDQPHFMGETRNEHVFGKTGFTGCMVIIDAARETGIVMLANAIHPRRPVDKEVINRVRRAVAETVLAPGLPRPFANFRA